MPQVAVVIPAYNEADRVGATVTAARALPDVDLVVVVDDGSRDATAAVARAAGARALRYARNHGKAMAMMVGAREVAELDRRRPADGPRHLLFLDADLGATAGGAGPLIGPVAAGEADMTIAVFATRVKLGGHGFVVRLGGCGDRRATGWAPPPPLHRHVRLPGG